MRTLGYDVNVEEFVTHMRAGVENFLSSDEELAKWLASVKHRKVIFTNTRECEAKKALECLGISKYFDKVYGADFMDGDCKPSEAVFTKVLADCGAAPMDSVMFEDSMRNVVTAHGLGMRTVFIRGKDPEQGVGEASGGAPDKVIDVAVDFVAQLSPENAPWLFD